MIERFLKREHSESEFVPLIFNLCLKNLLSRVGLLHDLLQVCVDVGFHLGECSINILHIITVLCKPLHDKVKIEETDDDDDDDDTDLPLSFSLSAS